MKTNNPLFTVAVALLFSAAPSLFSTEGPTPHAVAATSCIERTHGNEKACHIGKGNAATLPYEPANIPSTTNDCITRRLHDWRNCDLGNDGAGDRPYAPK